MSKIGVNRVAVMVFLSRKAVAPARSPRLVGVPLGLRIQAGRRWLQVLPRSLELAATTPRAPPLDR